MPARTAIVGLSTVAALTLTVPLAVASPTATTVPATGYSVAVTGDLPLLTDPFLQSPTASAVTVAWMTEFPGSRHLVLTGEGVDELTEAQLATAAFRGRPPAGVRVHRADSAPMSRTVEDSASQLPATSRPAAADGIVRRDVHRHEAVVRGLRGDTPYRVVSAQGSDFAASATYTLGPAAAPGEGQRVLLTSDHQAMVNTPANLQVAAETVGDLDAVFFAGDLVNHPDRASEWFDDTRGSAFFPVLQGHAGRVATDGRTYTGAPIIQNAPLYPAVGNHEVQGRVDGLTSIGASYNAPVPREVAEDVYAEVADEVNPTGDPAVRAQWLEDNSYSTRTYEEIFTLPETSPGGETYYATTVGNIRLISLYSTRIWRGTANQADPAARTAGSRYQEAASSLDDPLAQGYGKFHFEAIDRGSEQYEWLQAELASPEFRRAEHTVVMIHESPQGLGDNVGPAFADPVRIEETDADGEVVGVRYEYPLEDNVLLTDLQPLLTEAGVDLVHNGHSHLWNRFRTEGGTNFLESSNTGNSYGAYHPLSGRSRHVPGAPWDADNYLAQGNPGGLEPVVPTVEPLLAADGTPLPFLWGNQYAAFTLLDSHAGEVTTWVYDLSDPDAGAWVLDRFELG
ncbi:hypothetical protein [Aquipuribacter sp. MA13-6]|uniref:hypothetical protein n=1 Tax=unclassified Aquipuribacter TaxID=2635084 RepID=UPI003EED99CC